MWKLLKTVVVALLISTTTMAATAQKVVKADDVLKEAKAKAADQNKAIFLVFGASWCEACHQLDIFFALPKVAAILDKYFIVAKVTIGEGAAGHPDWDNPGSDTLLMKYGGMTSRGEASLPFIALLDQKAKLIVNSNRPVKNNAGGEGMGFPTEPEEISWFLGMLQKAAPAMTAEEAHIIQEGLREAAAE